MACVDLVVDAANVVGSRPDGWWRDRPGAAARLVSALAAALRSGALTGPVVVVLEGAARAGAPAGEVPVTGAEAADGEEPPAETTERSAAGGPAAGGPVAGGPVAGVPAAETTEAPADRAEPRTAGDGSTLRVVHASRDGDSAIVDEVTALVAAGGSPTVITADRVLRDQVLAAGGAVVGPSWLLDRL
jgi:8-oxo-dGTP diphosphatase